MRNDLIRHLVNAAMDVLHHDGDETHPIIQREMRLLTQKFSQILQHHRPLTKSKRERKAGG